MDDLWNASQGSTMAQVIPVLALALGLEMRELRKSIDGMLAPAHGKHKTPDVQAVEPDKASEAPFQELAAQVYSKTITLALFSCFAMFVLLKGEQSAISAVLGTNANQVRFLRLGLNVALTVIFLSPVAQLVFSFAELVFRRESVKPATRAKVLAIMLSLMLAVGYTVTFF